MFASLTSFAVFVFVAVATTLAAAGEVAGEHLSIKVDQNVYLVVPDDPEDANRFFEELEDPRSSALEILYVMHHQQNVEERIARILALSRKTFQASRTTGPEAEWQQQVLRDFDGSEEKTVELLRMMGNYHGINIPCEYILRNRALVLLAGPVGPPSGSFDVTKNCGPKILALPDRVAEYFDEVRKLRLPSWRCGSIARYYGARESAQTVIRRFYPESWINDDTRTDGPPRRRALDVWRLFSAWNWRHANQLEALHAQALIDLRKHYEKVVALEKNDADRVAKAALLFDHLFTQLPVPVEGFRYAILEGQSINEIAVRYPNR